MPNTITPPINSSTGLPSDSSVDNKQEPPITVPVLGGAYGTIFVGDSSNPDTYCSFTHFQQGCRTKRFWEKQEAQIRSYCACPPPLKTNEEKDSNDAVAVQGK